MKQNPAREAILLFRVEKITSSIQEIAQNKPQPVIGAGGPLTPYVPRFYLGKSHVSKNTIQAYSAP